MASTEGAAVGSGRGGASSSAMCQTAHQATELYSERRTRKGEKGSLTTGSTAAKELRRRLAMVKEAGGASVSAEAASGCERHPKKRRGTMTETLQHRLSEEHGQLRLVHGENGRRSSFLPSKMAYSAESSNPCSNQGGKGWFGWGMKQGSRRRA